MEALIDKVCLAVTVEVNDTRAEDDTLILGVVVLVIVAVLDVLADALDVFEFVEEIDVIILNSSMYFDFDADADGLYVFIAVKLSLDDGDKLCSELLEGDIDWLLEPVFVFVVNADFV